MITNYSSEF